MQNPPDPWKFLWTCLNSGWRSLCLLNSCPNCSNMNYWLTDYLCPIVFLLTDLMVPVIFFYLKKSY
jgi:hypothetical protein